MLSESMYIVLNLRSVMVWPFQPILLSQINIGPGLSILIKKQITNSREDSNMIRHELSRISNRRRNGCLPDNRASFLSDFISISHSGWVITSFARARAKHPSESLRFALAPCPPEAAIGTRRARELNQGAGAILLISLDR